MLWCLFIFVNYKFHLSFNCQYLFELVCFLSAKVGQLDSVLWVQVVPQVAVGLSVPLVSWVYLELLETNSLFELDFAALGHLSGSSLPRALCLIIIKIVQLMSDFNTILCTHLGCKKDNVPYRSKWWNIPLLRWLHLNPRRLPWQGLFSPRPCPRLGCRRFLGISSLLNYKYGMVTHLIL